MASILRTNDHVGSLYSADDIAQVLDIASGAHLNPDVKVKVMPLSSVALLLMTAKTSILLSTMAFLDMKATDTFCTIAASTTDATGQSRDQPTSDAFVVVMRVVLCHQLHTIIVLINSSSLS